jgi:anti-anti-sigma factor
VTEPESRTLTVLVKLPSEIDYTNNGDVYADLLAAASPDAKLLVADMTQTRFCDTAGIREIIRAQRNVNKTGVVFRLVVPPGPVLRVVQLHGLGDMLRPYATLDEALNS